MKRFFPRSLSLALGIAALISLITASACSGYGTPAQSPSQSASSTPVSGNTVIISGFAFSPPSLTVKAGTTVTWTNKDSTPHTITGDGGTFASGDIGPNATFQHTFNAAGAFAYHCAIHPYMKGMVIVQ